MQKKQKIKIIKILSILFLLIVLMKTAISLSKDLTPSEFGANRLLVWLCNVDIEEIKKSPSKYIIMDYSADGSKAREFKRKQIEDLRNSLPGKRVVLSYISIGEAEDYRFYWNKNWKPDPDYPNWKGSPKFMGPENPNWIGNYVIDYRAPQWQKIIFSYIDKIIDQGFDGIYMDRIDTYWTLKEIPYNIKDARSSMIEFVIAISKYAKKKKPGFKIIAQNAEELVVKEDGVTPNDRYIDAIDGIGKESAFYWDNRRRSEYKINRTVNYLDKVKEKGKLVFTLDYPDLNNDREIKWIYQKARLNGYLEYIGPRNLDRMILYP